MKTIIFDFDGTVGDTLHCIVNTFNYTFDTMNVPKPDTQKIINLIGLPLVDMYRRLSDLDEAGIQTIAQLYHNHFNDFVEEGVQSFPHVKETLRTLYEKGYILAIATSRGRDSLSMLLDILELSPYISIKMADEDVINKKPAPEMVLKILEQTSTPPSEVLVVGDTVYDIEMGQRAGCQTCGVSYGNNTREQLLAQGADSVIDDMAELIPLLR